MKIDEGQLMALVDDELAPDAAVQVAAAVSADPGLQRRLGQLLAQRRRVATAWAQTLEEAVPAGLEATLEREKVRAAAPTRRRSSGARPFAVAAAAVLGLALGLLLPRAAVEPPIGIDGRAGMLASGELVIALDSAPSGRGDGLDVLFSFLGGDGRACRVFRMPSVQGMACRDGGRWRLDAMVSREDAGGDLRMASSALAPALVAEVDNRMVGDIMSTEQELRAIASGWR
ncbi:MAG: hypothetical protein ACXIUZ_09920 [Lysobacteraceae bacterium]